MIHRLNSTLTLTYLFLLTFAISVAAADTEYKDYKPATTSTTTPYFEIRFDDDYIEFVAFDLNDTESSIGFYRRELEVKDQKVYVDNRVIIDDRGVHVMGLDLKWDLIHSIEIKEAGGRTRIILNRSDNDSNAATRRRGNLFEYWRDVEVDADEFIRGSILAVLGNIRVDGEVNRDIVALFGDISLTGDAAARGDVVAMSGNVSFSKSSSIYGNLIETKSDQRTRAKRQGRRGRFYRESRHMDVDGGFIYNRVDGAHPWLGYKFTDQDSLLPTVSLRVGYAFNSERWRYQIGLEQAIMRNIPITIGGTAYRRLASEDSWLVGETENTVFSILANEDYMDYYESDGGSVFMRVKPLGDLTFEGGYQYDKTNWLPARAHLWTLFGGSKLFRDNFSSVEESFRASGIQEIDTTEIGSLYLSSKYDNVGEFNSFPFNGTRATFEYEWSDPDLSSDFDYERYVVSATHYLRLNRRAMLTLGGRYGNSSGYLPMHKRFYLGGLSTLRGYDHKEYMGTEYWLANAEYRFELPGTSISLALLYDVGQIANEIKLADTELLHSLGLALYLSDNFSLSFSKRLDRSENDDPIFLVRFTDWRIITD